MTQSKYNPDKYGTRTLPHHYKIYDVETGLYFPTTNGCQRHKNCLTCPFPDCTFNEGEDKLKGE